MRQRTLPLLLLAAAVAADEAPAQRMIEELRAANAARQAREAEADAWLRERERIRAAIAAAVDDAARHGAQAEVQAGQAAQRRSEAEAARAAAGELARVRAVLDEAGQETALRLAAVARVAPPGALAPAGSGFEDAARAMDAAERAAAAVAVEVVRGRLAGTERAVKLLRVGGAAAWWVALDGGQGGVARMRDGELELAESDESGRRAILAAIAIAEGRRPAELVLLPAPEPR